MGFSVSASAAIVFVGFVVAFTTLYPVAANGFERVNDARSDSEERALERENTDVELANVSYDAGADELTVRVNNTGTTDLSVNDTDVLVDNTHWVGTRSVDGDASTDVWLPGETLTVTISNVTIEPNRVTVVADHGVSVGGSP